MMKEMRGAGESLFKDNHLRSNEMDIHQENFDNQLSMTLSDSGGIGLADMMYRQLSKRYNAEEPPTPVTGGTTFAPQATALYREVSRHEPD